jgi:hypothetical protein
MPAPTLIDLELLRKERDMLRVDLKTSQDQLDIAVTRLVKARRLLKRWVGDWANASGGVGAMDQETRKFLATVVFNEEQ